MSSLADQTVVLKDAAGNSIDFLLSDFDDFSLSKAQTSMIFSAQCSMSLLLALILLLTSKREKIQTLLFFLNLSGLVAVFIRACLQCVYLSSRWTLYSVQFLGALDLLSSSDFYLSIIASCMPIFIVLLIELSLLVQIRVIYASQRNLQMPFTIIFGIITLVVVSFWIVSAVQNSMAILNQRHFGNSNVWGAPWPYSAARISFASSILIGCSIFISKLLIAIYRRHKLGITGFGPLQIIFIMSCQTLIIPTFLVFLDFGVKITGFSSLTQASVAMSLPLSSIWASSKTETSKKIMSEAYYSDISTRHHSIWSSPDSLNKSPYLNSRKLSYISSKSPKSSYYDNLHEDNTNQFDVYVNNSVDVASEKV